MLKIRFLATSGDQFPRQFGGNLNSEILRCVLDKIRTFFEKNPEEI